MIYKILSLNKKFFGTILGQIDSTIITVISALLKFASPGLNLKGYADASNEPESPILNDCYLVLADGNYWSVSALQYDFVTWDGSRWIKEAFNLNELNTAFQSLFFEAQNINVDPIYGLSAGNVQEALEELAEEHFGPDPGSGSTT